MPNILLEKSGEKTPERIKPPLVSRKEALTWRWEACLKRRFSGPAHRAPIGVEGFALLRNTPGNSDVDSLWPTC